MQFFSRLRSFSFSAIALALASLFIFFIRVKFIRESNLISLHRIYISCPYSRMLFLLKLNFVCLFPIFFWDCTSLCLAVHLFNIIIFVFIVYLCRSKIWLRVLILRLNFSTFLPIFFIENVNLTVFNLAFNFMKFRSLTNSNSFVLVIAFKAEIAIQSVYVFEFWVLIILLLRLIIIIRKTLSSISCLYINI